MLPYFAVAGRNLYVTSVYTHLQDMESLESTHPDVYQKFLAGYHVVRTTDNLWACLSSDLVIEKELMRNIKSTGGLTTGRCMTEVQRHVWVQSMISCTEMTSAMHLFTDVIYQSSDHHKESFVARQHCDFSFKI